MSNLVQRLLLFAGTTVFCVILWLAVVAPSDAMYEKLQQDEIEAQSELEQYREKSTRVAEIEVESAGMRMRIKEIEETLPSGDSYRWIVLRIQHYAKMFDLDVLEVQRPKTRECTTMPPLGSSEVVFTVQGHAERRAFHAFVSAIESDLSQMRIEKLFVSSQTTRVLSSSRHDRYFEMIFAITPR